MICVPIAPESRTLARVDLLNAARVADMVELCLDRFVHLPDVAELTQGIEKPVIVSCRRRKEGGNFEGTEAERIALLKEALTARPAMIELEHDIAPSFPRAAGTKRLISFNRPFRALTDVGELQTQAMQVGADAVKFVWPGVLIDSLAPVLSAIAQSTKPPIVGVPIGHGGRAFSLLAQRLGAPWVYAALEQGMEPFDGMPLIQDLESQFGLRKVNSQTRLVGVVGFGDVRDRTVRAFNSAAQELELNLRALPLEVGPVSGLPELLDQVDITAVVVTPGMGHYLLPMIAHPEPAVALSQHADLILRKREGWHGYNLFWRSLLKTVERTLKRQQSAPLSLQSTTNLILGTGRLSRSILHGLTQLNGTGIVAATGPVDEVAFCPHCGEALDTNNLDTAGPHLAPVDQVFGVRQVNFSEINSTRPDVVFLTDPALELGFHPMALNPLHLQPPLVVVDANSMFQESDILSEARARGCRVVRPRYVLGEQLAAQFRAVTGKELTDSAFQAALELSP